jgi:hypothetical protein
MLQPLYYREITHVFVEKEAGWGPTFYYDSRINPLRKKFLRKGDILTFKCLRLTLCTASSKIQKFCSTHNAFTYFARI